LRPSRKPRPHFLPDEPPYTHLAHANFPERRLRSFDKWVTWQPPEPGAMPRLYGLTPTWICMVLTPAFSSESPMGYIFSSFSAFCNSTAAGNQLLPGFLAGLQCPLRQGARNPKNLHRPLSAGDDLTDVFAWREELEPAANGISIGTVRLRLCNWLDFAP
jgi:hypothetical protein